MQAGELTRHIARTSNDIIEITQESFQNQQDAYDRIDDNFAEAIRGVETYENAFEGRSVELPSDFREARVSMQGEFALSCTHSILRSRKTRRGDNSAVYSPNGYFASEGVRASLAITIDGAALTHSRPCLPISTRNGIGSRGSR